MTQLLLRLVRDLPVAILDRMDMALSNYLIYAHVAVLGPSDNVVCATCLKSWPCVTWLEASDRVVEIKSRSEPT